MSVAENLEHIKSTLPKEVTLVAVSKTKPDEAIIEAYNAGQRVFGENKIQELTAKYDSLPKDIEWHMIGHVQTNKVKYIAPFVHLIHGIDRIKVLKEINKQGIKNDRVINCLLQVHIAQEDTKFGFSENELLEFIKTDFKHDYPNAKIVGVMGMASNVKDEKQVAEEFSTLKNIADKISENFGPDFNIVSMGMSGDYKIAIAAGSNMVRVGSSIFGARNYSN